MPAEADRRKQFLFVDDDAGFLSGIKDIFTEMARGTWNVFTAVNHSQALALLRDHRMDVVVVDLDMPVMDGLQFLRLLSKTNPGQQAVILTGRVTDDRRKACLDSGAALVMEKVIAPEGFSAVFAALDALAASAPQEGFRGVMRKVGLQEVLQMECLSRKSSVLEVFAGKVRGRIFICDGDIIHADSGTLQGEVALYGLLALRGGEFNFRPFAEPPQRSINGHWEALMMEAARLSDEGTQFFTPENTVAAVAGQAELLSTPFETQAPAQPTAAPATRPERPPVHARPVRIEEVVLCSGSGEVIYEWECTSLERRLRLLEQLEQQGTQLSGLGPMGRFDRLEIVTWDARMLCEVQPYRRLFVRSRPIEESA